MTRVLVLGLRNGLTRALRARGIPFSLWLEQAPKHPPKGVPVVVAPFAVHGPAARKTAERFREFGEHTHVIASVEGGVVAASHARRALGARRSKHTVANRCHDKLYMKERMDAAGVPVTQYLDLNQPDAIEKVAELGKPLVVKDRRSSGSRGLDIVDSAEEVKSIPIRNRLAESFVRGVEMSVESFVQGGRVLWTNMTEYYRPREVSIAPARLSEANARAVLDVNRATIEALAIDWGMTHLELFLSAAGPVVSEIALRPPGGYIMDILRLSTSFDPWATFLSVELGETPVLGPERTSAGAVIFHPGEGVVDEIVGADEVRAHPLVKELKLKVDAGDAVGPRLGVGIDVGHALIAADSYDEVVSAVRFVDGALHITLADEPQSPA